MPKREIHVERKDFAHEYEEMEERGVASSQQMILWSTVRMREYPWEVQRGLTMLTWAWENCLSEMEMGSGGGETW